MREAIENPAVAAGYRLERGLADVIVSEAEGQPGVLPMLSHALAETWHRRDGAVMTLHGYRTTGGIRGAIGRTADELYDSLFRAPDGRSPRRAVPLVAQSPGGEPVGSRVATKSLLGDREREQVLAQLVNARLVTAGMDTRRVGARVLGESVAEAAVVAR